MHRTVPRMDLESAEATASRPQNHTHLNTLRRFRVRQDDGNRHSVSPGRCDLEIDARTTTAASADDLGRLELADITTDARPDRPEEGFDEVVLGIGERSWEAGHLRRHDVTRQHPQLQPALGLNRDCGARQRS